MKKHTLRQYFTLHSTAVSAKDGVVIKILDPFEIEVACLLCDHRGENSFELCVRFKQSKRFKDAFNLGSVDEVTGDFKG